MFVIVTLISLLSLIIILKVFIIGETMQAIYRSYFFALFNCPLLNMNFASLGGVLLGEKDAFIGSGANVCELGLHGKEQAGLVLLHVVVVQGTEVNCFGCPMFVPACLRDTSYFFYPLYIVVLVSFSHITQDALPPKIYNKVRKVVYRDKMILKNQNF